jgi:hypothetical protein
MKTVLPNFGAHLCTGKRTRTRRMGGRRCRRDTLANDESAIQIAANKPFLPIMQAIKSPHKAGMLSLIIVIISLYCVSPVQLNSSRITFLLLLYFNSLKGYVPLYTDG